MLQKGIIVILFVAGMFGMAFQPCMAQEKHTAPNFTPAPAPDPNGPVMSFETKEHDFGTIQQDDNGTYYFIFTNTGKEPMVINNAKGSCGCTVPKWPHSPVNPGMKDTIKVTYDTHRVGVFVKTVTITSNSKDSPTMLTIKGKVLSKDSYPAFPTNNSNSDVPYTNNWDNANQ